MVEFRMYILVSMSTPLEFIIVELEGVRPMVDVAVK